MSSVRPSCGRLLLLVEEDDGGFFHLLGDDLELLSVAGPTTDAAHTALGTDPGVEVLRPRSISRVPCSSDLFRGRRRAAFGPGPAAGRCRGAVGVGSPPGRVGAVCAGLDDRAGHRPGPGVRCTSTSAATLPATASSLSPVKPEPARHRRRSGLFVLPRRYRTRHHRLSCVPLGQVSERQLPADRREADGTPVFRTTAPPGSGRLRHRPLSLLRRVPRSHRLDRWGSVGRGGQPLSGGGPLIHFSRFSVDIDRVDVAAG